MRAAPLIAFALAACAPAPASDLEGAWIVQQIAGASLNAEAPIYFTIAEGAVRGSTGCNDFTASLAQFSESISISNIVEADAPCPDEAAATNEARFLGVLPSVARFRRRGESLELLARDAAPDALILARSDGFATLAQ